MLHKIERPRKKEKEQFNKDFNFIDQFLNKEKRFCMILRRIYGYEFNNFCSDCFLCNGENFFEDRAFRINHINKIKNQKLETITLSYDLNQQHILKFGDFLDILCQTQKV